jgi:hypothetical protein
MCCLLKPVCGLQDGVKCNGDPQHDHTTHIRIPIIRHLKLPFSPLCFDTASCNTTLTLLLISITCLIGQIPSP